MDDEGSEKNHFISICKVLNEYSEFSSFLFERKLARLENLSDHQKSFFPYKPLKMRNAYQIATNQNQQYLDAVVGCQGFFENLEVSGGREINRDGFERIEAILHSCVRLFTTVEMILFGKCFDKKWG